MPETKVQIKDIQKLKVKGEIVEEKLEGEDDPVKRLVTTVTFQYEGLPGALDPIQVALAADCPVNIVLGSPQANLGDVFMETSKQEA